MAGSTRTGEYTVSAGHSSRDLPLSVQVVR